MGDRLLEIEDLRTLFVSDEGTARAVDSVSLAIDEGEVLGLVGESGCGKSVTALSILRLIPEPPGKIAGGSIRFRGTELLSLGEREIGRIRGNKISMVFQEPMTSLNPVFTCGRQIVEVLARHRNLSGREARNEAVEILRIVGIPDPEERFDDYPHSLSGGMRQRVLLAVALACRPDLLIADEPTTALDVTIQAQILKLILDLRERFGMAVLLITHDLGVVAEVADRVAVMYAGEVIEEAPVNGIFENPRHPYTRALLRSVPDPAGHAGPLLPVEGNVPSAYDPPAGCRFHPRCSRAEEKCRADHPEIDGEGARCFFPGEDRP